MPKNLLLPKVKPAQEKGSVLRIPRTKTAAMVLLLDLLVHGYIYWTRGTVPYDKALRVAQKFDQLYGIGATPAQRSYRSKHGKANTRLIMYPDDDTRQILWWLVATRGRGLIHEREHLFDARRRKQRLLWTHQYVLAYRQRSGKRGGKSTWSWWLQRPYLQEWESALIYAASRHGKQYPTRDKSGTKYKPDERKERKDDLIGFVTAVKRMPMFAGVRSQVIEMLKRADQMWHKGHAAAPPFSVKDEIPWIGTRMPLYDEPPMTLEVLIKAMKQYHIAGEQRARDMITRYREK